MPKATAKPKTTEPTTIEFEISDIPIEEAQRLGAAGTGKFGALAEQLLNRLRDSDGSTLPVFSLPKGQEMAERERRGVCISLNTAFKRAGLYYRVTYSSEKKLFVVLPRTKSKMEKPIAAPSPTFNPRVAEKAGPDLPARLTNYASQLFGVDANDLRGVRKNPKLNLIRGSIVAICHKRSKAKYAAQFFGRDLSGMYKLKSDPQMVAQLEARLTKNGAPE